jgi:hypothetical protein
MRNLKSARQSARRTLMRFKTGDVLALEQDPSAGQPHMSRNRIEHGGLACAVWPDKPRDPPGGYVEADVIDDIGAA